MNDPKTTIRIKVNGQERTVPEGCSISKLMELMGIPQSFTAIELAGKVVSQSEFNSTVMKAGESVEIIRLVGGG